MRILLPPSEAKTTGGDGPPVEFDGPLGPTRQRVAEALVAAASADPGATATALALPPASSAQDLAANAAVLTSATRPALQRYSGIVYAGLSAATLTPVARDRATEAVLIFSGLLGVVQADEPVPLYRVPASAALPGLGGVAPAWRATLAAVVPTLLGDGLIVDLRSTDYAGLWRPAAELRDRVATVRVLSRRPGREPTVVSYDSKLGKGRLARELLRRRAPVRTRRQILEVWLRAVGTDGRIRPDGGVDLIL